MSWFIWVLGLLGCVHTSHNSVCSCIQLSAYIVLIIKEKGSVGLRWMLPRCRCPAAFSDFPVFLATASCFQQVSLLILLRSESWCWYEMLCDCVQVTGIHDSILHGALAFNAFCFISGSFRDKESTRVKVSIMTSRDTCLGPVPQTVKRQAHVSLQISLTRFFSLATPTLALLFPQISFPTLSLLHRMSCLCTGITAGPLRTRYIQVLLALWGSSYHKNMETTLSHLNRKVQPRLNSPQMVSWVKRRSSLHLEGLVGFPRHGVWRLLLGQQMGQQLKVPMAKPDDLAESPSTHMGEGKIKSHRLFCDFPMCLMVCACPLHSQINLKSPQRPVFWRFPFVSSEVQSCGRAKPLWIRTAYLWLFVQSSLGSARYTDFGLHLFMVP